jgi:hypothetical protein
MNGSQYGNNVVGDLLRQDREFGAGLPLGWWLDRASEVRLGIIKNTAEAVGTALVGQNKLLSKAVAAGINAGLGRLTDPRWYAGRGRIDPDLANSSHLIGQHWAAAYAKKLGAGLGDKSADGLLVSMSTLQRSNMVERQAWKALENAAGLPHGQALSVTQVAINRINAALGSRKPITAKDFAADVGKLYLSQRARRIAENESQVAFNFGTQLVLMNAVQKGYLPVDARKVWVTAVDERVCPVCAPMDSVAVKIDEPFSVRAHHGLLSHDVSLWVPPAHPSCRCRVVPDSAIAHGIITRTARFSRDETGRARLRSRLADIIEAGPSWSEDQAVNKANWAAALHPRSRTGQFVLASALGAAAAREAASVVATHYQTKHGYAVSSGFLPRKRFRSIKGVTDAPAGTKLRKDTHPEGVYLASMASLARYRSKTSVRPSENPAKLRRSMQKNGFTVPVQVRVYDNGAHLWDGNHRLNLAEELGIKAVPVQVVHMGGKVGAQRGLLAAFNRLQQKRYRHKIVARYQAVS